VLSQLGAAQRQALVGRDLFASLILVPFRQGLHAAFDFAIVACLAAAAASWSRGRRHASRPGPGPPADVPAVPASSAPGTPELTSRR